MNKTQAGASVLADLKRLLRVYGLSPRKSLGQNFLVDRSALQHIVAAADLAADDVVIEVGPGPGVLTRELLARAARVIAVEKDEGMADLLRKELGGHPKLRVVAGDMLDQSPEGLLNQRGPYKVVANLPYYAASPILRRFLESSARPTVMVILLQKEVAQQVAAVPGNMSMLSLAIQYYAVPSVKGTIKAGSFYPAPKVDSAIVRLDVRPAPAVDVEPDRFFRTASAGFSAPRKQIANSLSRGLGVERGQVLPALEAAGIASQRRAETLSLEEWAALARALERSVFHAV